MVFIRSFSWKEEAGKDGGGTKFLRTMLATVATAHLPVTSTVVRNVVILPRNSTIVNNILGEEYDLVLSHCILICLFLRAEIESLVSGVHISTCLCSEQHNGSYQSSLNGCLTITTNSRFTGAQKKNSILVGEDPQHAAFCLELSRSLLGLMAQDRNRLTY